MNHQDLLFYREEVPEWPQTRQSGEIYYTQLNTCLYRVDLDQEHTGLFRYRPDLPQTRMETQWDLLVTEPGDHRAELLAALPSLADRKTIRTLSTATL